MIIFSAPAFKSNLQIAIPAEPAPFIIILTSLIFFLVNFNALYKPDNTTTAVPCWSSWNTGIFNSLFKVSSI